MHIQDLVTDKATRLDANLLPEVDIEAIFEAVTSVGSHNGKTISGARLQHLACCHKECVELFALRMRLVDDNFLSGHVSLQYDLCGMIQQQQLVSEADETTIADCRRHGGQVL